MLETSMDVEPRDGALEFQVRVTNRGDTDEELSFSDSQRVRVTVYGTENDNDEPHWRSDEDQMFMQMLGSETVPAGEEILFQEEWNEADAGEYRAVGEVVCRDCDLRAETAFSV